MANRFWVGGTATWDNSTTANWSTTDGGGSGASVPGSGDTAKFTASSGSGTVTLNYDPTLTGLDFTGFTGTFVDAGHTVTTGALTVVSGMTLTHTGQFTLTGNAAPALSNKSYHNISATAYTAGVTWTGASGLTIANLTIANTSSYINVDLPSMTVTGSLSINGANNNTQRIATGSNSFFTRNSFTINGTVSLSNIDLLGWNNIGSTAITGTSIGNAGNNAGTITFDSPRTLYMVLGANTSVDFNSGNIYSTSSGGSVGQNMPLAQDSLIIDSNSFTATGKTVTSSINSFRFPTMDWSSVTNAPTFSVNNPVYIQAFKLASSGAMTYTNTGTVTTFRDITVGTYNITTAGQTILAPTLMYGPSSVFNMQDDFNSSGVFSFNIGTWTTNGHDVNVTRVSSTGGSARTINMGTGSTWNLSGSGNTWNFNGASNITINANTSTIKFTANSSSNSSFFGNAKTYYNFWNNTTSTGICIIQDSNTFNDFKVDAGRTQQFVAATNTTFKSLTATGTSGAGNGITITSSTSATHTLTHTPVSLATRFVSCDYLTLSYSIASPANSFYAGSHSTDSGNNTGWIFQDAPTENISNIGGVTLANILNKNGISAGTVYSFNGIV